VVALTVATGAYVTAWWISDQRKDARANAQHALDSLLFDISITASPPPNRGPELDPNRNGGNGAIKAPTDRNGLRKAMEKAGDKAPEGLRNPEAHHNLPWKFRDWFAEKGLDVNDTRFGRWVEGSSKGNGGPHQQWSKEYEQAWEDYISQNRGASADDVLRELERLLNDPNFPASNP